MKPPQQLLDDIVSTPADPNMLSLWWLGQMGYVIKSGETTIVVDAFLSEHPRRKIPPLLNPSAFSCASMFIGTHDHKDHIDREVWPVLAEASPDAPFVVPAALKNRIAQELSIDQGRFVGINDGDRLFVSHVELSGVASAHEFLDRDAETGLYPYMGVVIRINGFTVYHPGDTCLYEGLEAKLRKAGPFDVMFLPINGRDAHRYSTGYIGCMTYQEAVDLAGTLKPQLVIPGHYDLFAHNGENPDLFVDYLKVKYPDQATCLCEHGERLSLKH